MQRNVTWLLLVVVVGAVAAIGWMMLQGPGSQGTGGLDRADLDSGSGLRGALDDAGRLRKTPGAKPPPTPEELEAMRREAAAPSFPRREGVFGRVTDAAGRPIPDAVVKLLVRDTPRWWNNLSPDPDPIAQSVSNEEGDFLVGPAPEGLLRLRVEASGYAPSVESLRSRGYRVDVVLDRGGSLDVTVKDDEGRPLPGATVLHTIGSFIGMVVTERVTDDAGVARFAALPTGTGSVLVSAPDRASVQQDGIGVAPGEHTARTIVLPTPLRLEGRVLAAEAEQPLPGASVRLAYPQQPWLELSDPVTADESGRYEIQALAPIGQMVRIDVEAEGRPPVSVQTQLVDADDRRMSFDLRVPAERTIFRGRVVDVAGRPVGGATVTYPSFPPGTEPVEASTNGAGEFELAAPPWLAGPNLRAQQIVASAPGEGVGSGLARVPKEGEPPQPTTIKLSGTGTVTGVVTDAAGAPLEGALVLLEIDWQVARQAGTRLDWGLVSAAQNPDFARLDAVTDPQGAFRIEEVPEMAYRLTASHGLVTVIDPEPVRVAGGGTVNRRVTLGEGLTIEGWVRDGDGRPVPGAHVEASPASQPGGPTMSKGLVGRSQSDGRFVLPGATDADYHVFASAAGFRSNRRETVRGGTTDAELVLIPMGWVDGRVELNGVGYAGTFTIRALPVRDGRRGRQRGQNWVQGPNGAFFPGGGGSTNTFSPDDGSFRLEGLPGGEYDLEVTTPEGWIAAAPVRVRVVDGRGTEAVVPLSQGSVVRGRLVDDLTNEAVSGARVYAAGRATEEGKAAPAAHATTDAEGRYVLRGLGGGPYSITVTPPSGIAISREVDLQIGEERILDFREQAPGALRTLVTDADGMPVAGVEIAVRNAAGNMVWPNWQALQKELQKEGRNFTANTWNEVRRTDGSGVNLWRHLGPGTYEVSVPLRARNEGPAYRSVAPARVEVKPGRTAEVTLVVEESEDPSAPGRR